MSFKSYIGLTVLARCGHESKKKGKIIVGGRSFKVVLGEDPSFCLGCLEKKSIRCPHTERLLRADLVDVDVAGMANCWDGERGSFRKEFF